MDILAKLRDTAIAAMLGTAAIFANVGLANAEYPVSTVHLIVPYAPGGAGDMVGRIVADELG